MEPQALIIRSAGTNCDRELMHAFELAGAGTCGVHINELIEKPHLIEKADLIGFPGGFSYGDDIAAGRILANRLRHRLMEPLKEAIKCNVPMIGICNGFQVITKMGLLPDAEAGRQQATLADNASGRFTDKWISLTVPEHTVCIWTRGLTSLDLPIAHGEGRFVPESDDLLRFWQESGQIALRYATASSTQDSGRMTQDSPTFPGNPNGSVDDIAGVCDATGLVLGLMPHPERFTHPTHHPLWSRRSPGELDEPPAGLRLFQNAVEFVRVKIAEKQRKQEMAQAQAPNVGGMGVS
ncbi:MAG: phosphoribosylformylglycinamidine synthase subunit PurQ, partial [Phycisphaeraceae bacterium]